MSHAESDLVDLKIPTQRPRAQDSESFARHRESAGRRSGGASAGAGASAAPVLGPRELYVYWKTHDVDKALRAAGRMQAVLMGRITGLEAQLLQRDSTSDGRHTLMEIYRHPQGIDGPLETIISNAASPMIATLMASPRVVEAFRPCVQAP